MGSATLELEEKVERILNGDGLEVTDFDSAPGQAQTVALKKTVCYIVCAVIFNTKNEVLMVQEAKRECYGHWYLPAGRMEEKESVVEAMRREVKEEAGFDCQPITLLLVQEQGPRWIRFVFLAEVTGGSLKTEAEADAESIQAQWWDRACPLPLRGRDIMCLIDAGLKYKDKPWFPPLLPVDIPCPLVCQRLLLVFNSPDGELWILLSSTEDPRLPITIMDRNRSVTRAARRLVQDCMSQRNIKTWGILGLQHNGRSPGQTDGICFNTLLSVEHGGEDACPLPVLESPKFQWHKVDNQNLRQKILQRMTSGSLLSVHSLN